jgi:hypothetical protein
MTAFASTHQRYVSPEASVSRIQVVGKHYSMKNRCSVLLDQLSYDIRHRTNRRRTIVDNQDAPVTLYGRCLRGILNRDNETAKAIMGDPPQRQAERGSGLFVSTGTTFLTAPPF